MIISLIIFYSTFKCSSIYHHIIRIEWNKMFTLLQQFVEKKFWLPLPHELYYTGFFIIFYLNHKQYNIIYYIMSQISNCNNNDGIRIRKYARIRGVGIQHNTHNIAQRQDLTQVVVVQNFVYVIHYLYYTLLLLNTAAVCVPLMHIFIQCVQNLHFCKPTLIHALLVILLKSKSSLYSRLFHW